MPFDLPCIFNFPGQKKSGTFGAGRNISLERFFPKVLGRGPELIDLAAEERADTARSARMQKKKQVPLPEMGSDVVFFAQQKRPW